jgi:hypothetical protein
MLEVTAIVAGLAVFGIKSDAASIGAIRTNATAAVAQS